MSGIGTALVLGAAGGVGGEVARALRRHGWNIRALVRNPVKCDPAVGEIIRGDAMKRGNVMAAAAGAHLIVHAVNPPGYRDWSRLVLPMLENTIAAAQAEGARIALPGTVYNYGPDAGSVVDESAPQNPRSEKGRIRVAMERRLEQAAETGPTRVLILRCGDYFGPRPGNNWFSQALVKPGRPVGAVVYPGPLDIGHAWAYLPDVGETFALLAARDAKLSAFERFHVGGHWLTGAAIADAIRAAVGRQVPVRKLPWTLLRLLAPFNETLREMMELRPLWHEPLRLDNGRLVAVLGAEPHTPLGDAVTATLEGLGCLSPK